MSARTTFYLDKDHKKVGGVCAGVADYTGIDVTFVRIAAVVLLFLTHGVLFVAYFAAMWFAPCKPTGLYQDREDEKFWQGVRTNARRSTAEVRSKFRELDRRLGDIETLYTSRNTQLADEIDQLR